LGFVTPFQRLYHRLLVKRWEEYSMRRASRVIADSRFTADCIFEVFGRKDTEVIHLWVDTGRFVPAQGPKRRENGPFRLLFLGNPIKRKGFDLLPEVMKRLGPEFVLYYTAGRNAVHLRDMPPNMICLGRLSQEGVIRELQRAHALLFPSRFEGFGYAALEAMACGVPVIAARSSAIPEVVEHEKTGILCEIDDVSGLVQACRLLAENEGLRLNLAGQAREAAVARFDEEELLSQYLRLYEAL
jgi:glycosyltransferase involved in cell wall biosynthesis